MVVAALVISIVALLLCGLVALAVMELVADRPPDSGEPPDDLVEEFELPREAEGSVASSHGLPADIDGTSAHMVLVVSPVCTICQKLVASLDGAIPDGLTVMVTASDPVRMRKWAAVHGLPVDELVFDDDMSIVNALGVSSSPAAVGFVRGRVAFAANLGGRRALDDLFAQGVSILEDAPGLAGSTGDSRHVDQEGSP